MERRCKNCGESIEHKKSNAIYCSDKCKSEYWLYGENSQKVKEAKEGSITKRDFLRTNKKSEPKPIVNTVPLKGVIKDKQQPEIPKTIKNPKKIQLIQKINRLKDQLFTQKTRLQQLIQKKSELDGNNPVWFTASTGALVGTFWKKIRKQKIDFWSSLGYACLGGVAGGGLGLVMKNQMSNELETINKKWIPAVESNIVNLQKVIATRTKEFARLPEFIPNPDYVEPSQPVSDPTPVEFDQCEVAAFEPNGKIISSEDLKKMNFKSLNFKGNWFELLGQPAVNFKMAVFGKPGQGKSTFCLQLAHYLANNFGRVLYVSGEEGFSKTLKDKFKNNEAFNKNLHIANIHSGDELLEEVSPNTYHFIVIDSLNNMGIDVAELSEIEGTYSSSAIITISQSTKNGKFRGSQEVLHNADITLRVEDGFAKCEKNRFAPIGYEFRVF